MAKKFDFKNEWSKTKKQFAVLSKEAVKAAKKGEEGLVKLSKQGKLHLDSTTVLLKKEQLYHLIGKEYSGLKDPFQPSAKLAELIDNLRNIESEEKSIKMRIKKGKKIQAPRRK